MRFRGRTVISLLVVIATLMVAAQAFGAVACVDGCDDEGGGTACADCPLCSPTRPCLLLAAPDSPVAEPAGDYESLPTVHLSRTEDRGVFHVPKHLA